MIDEKEATRLDDWVQEAVKSGAKLLCGGKRDKAMLEATVLENVDPRQKVSCMEAFGPVALLQKYKTFDEAIAYVNDSVFGLQAGLFTYDVRKAMRAWDELDVGGVVVGDVPSFRVDNMPYGGVKGFRPRPRGIRYAIEDDRTALDGDARSLSLLADLPASEGCSRMDQVNTMPQPPPLEGDGFLTEETPHAPAPGCRARPFHSRRIDSSRSRDLAGAAKRTIRSRTSISRAAKRSRS
jgi:hypothetical protein